MTDLEQAQRAEHFPPDDPRWAEVLVGRGWLALLRGAAAEALEDFDGAIGLARTTHWARVKYRAMRYRAEALVALGRFAEAEASAREVASWADGHLGGFAHSYLSGEAYRVLGQVLDVRGDHDAAVREWRKAYEHYQDTVGLDAPGTRWVAAKLNTLH